MFMFPHSVLFATGALGWGGKMCCPEIRSLERRGCDASNHLFLEDNL
jgi:hypothetical protein